jgi:hypothetical protein
MPLIDEAALEARIRQIAREEAARPEFLHQRNVEQIAGIPGRQYLRDAHAKRFPSSKERRLLVARTSDVVAYYALRIATAAAPAANDASAETIALARVGCRRVTP